MCCVVDNHRCGFSLPPSPPPPHTHTHHTPPSPRQVDERRAMTCVEDDSRRGYINIKCGWRAVFCVAGDYGCRGYKGSGHVTCCVVWYVPDDHSRVVLSAATNVSNSDYVNASFIVSHPHPPLHTHTHTYLCTHTYTRTHAHSNTHTHTLTHTHTHTHTHARTHARTHTHTHTHTRTHATHTHTRTHARTHARMQHTHTHTHTYTQTPHLQA